MDSDLTSRELAELTGSTRARRQVSALLTLGMPFRVAGGVVYVARAVAEHWPQFKAAPAADDEIPIAATGMNAGLRAYQAERRAHIIEREARAAEYKARWKAEAPARRLAAERARQAKRRAAERQQTPAWADPSEIRRVYEEAARLEQATGIPHHVDHDYPLRGRLVSGLHVHTNLVVLPAGDNRRKGNKFTP